MTSRSRHAELPFNLRLWPLALALSALLACSDSPSGPAPRGQMTVRLITKGLDFPSTFRVQLNENFTGRNLKPGETVTLVSLKTGTYKVSLIQLLPNCASPETEKEVIVEADRTVSVDFEVTCVAVAGALRVSVTTSGVDVDPTGYRVVLSTGQSFIAAANGTLVFPGISAGSQTIGLSDIATNCSLVSSSTTAISISVGTTKRDTASASYNLTCSRAEKFAFKRINSNTSAIPQSVAVAYLDGTETVSIVGGYAPAWSPNGSSIAFGWFDCGYYYYYGCNKAGLAALNTETGVFIQLTKDTLDSDPAYRPSDGAVIVFGRGTSLYFVGAAMPNGSATILATPKEVLRASQPSWSPDASRIAFACAMDDGLSDICSISADGTGFVRLTHDTSIDGNPEWSPDGSRIAFSTDAGGDTQIALMASTGGPITKLTAGKNPAWSRDGTKLLFESTANAHGIFVFTLASGTSTRLTLGDDHDPAWRP